MKQYDRVTGSEKVTDHNGTHWHAQNYTNAIVTTLEELKELWDAGYQNGRFDGANQVPRTEDHFRAYFQNKGITI
jgi:hypothetical protein